MKRMKQFRIQYIHTWKCHNETLCVDICIDILNKQKYLFFSKTEEWVGTTGHGEDIWKGCRRVNIVEILRTHTKMGK
jgi:hypothetical protein